MVARTNNHAQTHCARHSRAAGLRAACAGAAMFSAAVRGLAMVTRDRFVRR